MQGLFEGVLSRCQGVLRSMKEYQGVFRVYFVSETAQVELRTSVSPCLAVRVLHARRRVHGRQQRGVAARARAVAPQLQFESKI